MGPAQELVPSPITAPTLPKALPAMERGLLTTLTPSLSTSWEPLAKIAPALVKRKAALSNRLTRPALTRVNPPYVLEAWRSSSPGPALVIPALFPPSLIAAEAIRAE